MAERLESTGHRSVAADVLINAKSLLVVVDGSGVLTDLVGDITEAVQGVGLSFGFVVPGEPRERGFAMLRSFVVLTELSVTPAQRVQREGFPHRRVQVLVQAQGVP